VKYKILVFLKARFTFMHIQFGVSQTVCSSKFSDKRGYLLVNRSLISYCAAAKGGNRSPADLCNR